MFYVIKRLTICCLNTMCFQDWKWSLTVALISCVRSKSEKLRCQQLTVLQPRRGYYHFLNQIALYLAVSYSENFRSSGKQTAQWQTFPANPSLSRRTPQLRQLSLADNRQEESVYPTWIQYGQRDCQRTKFKWFALQSTEIEFTISDANVRNLSRQKRSHKESSFRI